MLQRGLLYPPPKEAFRLFDELSDTSFNFIVIVIEAPL